jgi:hypothetical protein
LFGCGQGQFPIQYLWILIHYRRLTIAEWKQVEDRLQIRPSIWKGQFLSLGERLVLINSALTNMILYIISFFLLPKGFYTRSIIIDLDSFDMGTMKKRNID